MSTETRRLASSGLVAADCCLARLRSPIGDMVAVAASDACRLLAFADQANLGALLARLGQRTAVPVELTRSRLLLGLQEQLDAFFAGALTEFNIPLALVGSAFACEVWQALRGIGFGQTCSYGEIARAIGRPAAVRAVARAIGANPLSILIPCHRVIGSRGALTGYAGGLARKDFLLAHERPCSL